MSDNTTILPDATSKLADKMIDVTIPIAKETIKKIFNIRRSTFRKCVESIMDSLNLGYKIPRGEYKKFITDEMLEPAENPEEMVQKVQGFFDKYMDENDQESLKKVTYESCKQYLHLVKNDIELSDVYTALNKQTSIQNENSQNIQKGINVSIAKIDRNYNELKEIHNILVNTKQTNLTTTNHFFVDGFQNPLFLNEDIPLCDAYFEPYTTLASSQLTATYKDLQEVENNCYSTREVVDAFIEKETNYHILVLEGNPGVGKSSFLYYYADYYSNIKNYYFLSLASLNFDSRKSIDEIFTTKLGNDWNQYGSVLFLDGFDEIASKVEYDDFISFLNRLVYDHIKVIITSRFGYLSNINNIVLVTLNSYTDIQIEKWLDNFHSIVELPDYEKQKASLFDAIKQEQAFAELYGTPIFLYMVIALNIDITNIKSVAKLYEEVFNRLNIKLDTKYYEEATEYSCFLSLFMQSKSTKVYNSSDEEDEFPTFYQQLSGKTLDENYTQMIIANSYVKKITEGQSIIEYCHKSMQDYFSAKCIYNQLLQFDNQKTHENYHNYFLLLNKYDIKEEIPHLTYFFNEVYSRTRDIEDFALKLQEMYVYIIENEYPIFYNNWKQSPTIENESHKDIISIDMKNLCSSCAIFLRNHIRLLQEIFHKPVYKSISDSDKMEKEKIFINMIHAVTDYTSYCDLFWNYWNYNSLTSKSIISWSDSKNLNNFINNNMCIEQHHSNIYDIDFKMALSNPLNITLNKCEIKNSKYSNININGSEINNSSIWYTTINGYDIVNFHANDLKIYNSTIILRKVIDSTFTNCDFSSSKITKRKSEKKLEFDHVDFIDCTISDKSFYKSDFHFCRFVNCTMPNKFRDYIVKIGCEVVDALVRKSSI